MQRFYIFRSQLTKLSPLYLFMKVFVSFGSTHIYILEINLT